MTVVPNRQLGGVELVSSERNRLADVSIPAYQLRHFDAPVITVISIHGDHITVITGLSTYSEWSIIGRMDDATRDQRMGYGALIRRKRLAHDPPLSQEALARLVETDRTHINKIERGKINAPQPPLLNKLNAVLGIDSDEMLESLRQLPGFSESSPELAGRANIPHWITERDESLGAHLAGLVLTLEPGQVETIRRLFDLAERIASSRRERAEPGIAETSLPYDPHDPRARLLTLVQQTPELPDQAIESMLAVAALWDDYVKSRIVGAEPEPAGTAGFYSDPANGLGRW